MSTDLSQYKELYLQTARELLSEMKKNQEILNSEPKNMPALDAIHRAAHSLKSQSLVMGYPKIGLLNKELELFFLQLKEEKIDFDISLQGALERSLTSIAFSLDRIEKTNDEGDITRQIEEMGHIANL